MTSTSWIAQPGMRIQGHSCTGSSTATAECATSASRKERIPFDAGGCVIALRSLEVSLRDGGSPAPVFDLAWETLDDELFEQLCYDYLYAQPLFDSSRLEKIGKSRSRDGGRDIVAWTNPAAPMFRPPVKYIFQCKHIKADASLTPKHFHSISDVIEQYGAGGYGVMCSGYIDATLHDRVDAIAAVRNIDVRKVDRFQLERFLSRRPHIVEKYFLHR